MNCLSPLQGEIHDTDLPGVKIPGLVLKSLRDNKPAVDIRRDNLFHNPGGFGWDGGLGTSAYTDPAENMIGILFTQRMMDSPEPPKVFTDFWTLAHGAKG